MSAGTRLGTRRLVTAAVAVLALISCGSDHGIGSEPTGRVVGHVLAGPTCPVERPGGPACPPAPVAGLVEFVQDGRIVTSVSTDAEGGFEHELPAGTYTVSVDVGDRPFPVCGSVDVEVVADAETNVDIDCDTGIR